MNEALKELLQSPAKHSPAPWEVQGNDLVDYLDTKIAFFMASFQNDALEAESADRALIAAAPTLFHAARLAAVQLHEIWRNTKLPQDVQLSAGWGFSVLCQAISEAHGMAGRDSVFSLIDYLAAKGGAK